MTWQREVDGWNRRRQLARRMDGENKIVRQNSRGELTVRECIAALVDANSFGEIGTFVADAEYDEKGVLIKTIPATFIFGRATIDGRPVVVCGDDFSVRGGAADGAVGQMGAFAEQMANQLQLPIIRLIDGVGGAKSLESVGRGSLPANPAWNWVVDNMAKVPVIALGFGTVAGIDAARLATSHYSLMVEGSSHRFSAGPSVAARGQTVTKDELGGGDNRALSGAVDDVVTTQDEAFTRVRRFLSFLPQSVFELAGQTPTTDPVDRRDDWLLEAIPRDPGNIYDCRRILRAVLDKDSFFEMSAKLGGSMVTGFARLNGWTVAVIASDPRVYGAGSTAAALQKLTRFIDLANTFHLPVVDFADVPSFAVGVAAEKAGAIRYGSRALAALYQAQAPWCTVIVRRDFGAGGAANINPVRFRYRYAWPTGDRESMPFEDGIETADRAEIAAPSLQPIEARLERLRSPFRSAGGFLFEEIIDPRDTRPLLCDFAKLTAKLRQPGMVAMGMRP